jgi:DNA helicase-2/ATP-dependent DNA helicase PcrA
MYSFEKYLTGEDEAKNPARYIKTRNIFYVCCSRSIRNLAIVDLGAASPRKEAAVRALFGADRCFEV